MVRHQNSCRRETPPWGAVAPDGQSFMVDQNGALAVRPISDGSSKPIPGMQAEEFPIGWADSKHVFVQAITPTGLNIYKVDVESGGRELVADDNAERRDGAEAHEYTNRHYPGWPVDGVWLPHTTRSALPQRHAEVIVARFLAQLTLAARNSSKWLAFPPATEPEENA